MRASFGSLLVVPWILFALSSWNMDAVPVITAQRPPSEATVEVRDRGEVFSRGAERLAREAMQRIHREHAIPVRIETIKSLDGAWIADVAGQRARAVNPEQLYILVAGSERDVGVIAARHGPASRLTDQQRETVRRAFLGPLQAGETDGALEQGVRAIGSTLAAAAASKPTLTVWETLVSVTILLAALAILLVSQFWGWYGGRRKRRRGAVAGTVARACQ
jgi:uncharacterized membrane protein YgcG